MARCSSLWISSARDIQHRGSSKLLESHEVDPKQEPRDDPKVLGCWVILDGALPGSKQIPMAAQLDIVCCESFSSHMVCSSYMWVTCWGQNMTQVITQMSHSFWECLVVPTRFWVKSHSFTARVYYGGLQLICGSTSYFMLSFYIFHLSLSFNQRTSQATWVLTQYLHLGTGSQSFHHFLIFSIWEPCLHYFSNWKNLKPYPSHTFLQWTPSAIFHIMLQRNLHFLNI